MRHDTSIPLKLHTEMLPAIKEGLGSFWSSVFADQHLLDATIASRVLAAAQLHIDVMEALSLRDHNNLPVFHREHWFPVIIRKSQCNTGCGLKIRMADAAVIGPQPGGVSAAAAAHYGADTTRTLAASASTDPCSEYGASSLECCAHNGGYWCESISACTDGPRECRNRECEDGGGFWCDASNSCLGSALECDRYVCEVINAQYWCEPTSACVRSESQCSSPEDCTADGGYWCDGNGCVDSEATCCFMSGNYWCDATNSCVASEAECCTDNGGYWCDTTTSCVASEAECDCALLDPTTPEWCECVGRNWCDGACTESDCDEICSDKYAPGSAGYCSCVGNYWCEATGTCEGNKALCDMRACTDNGGYWCDTTTSCVASEKECDCALLDPTTPEWCECMGRYWCGGVNSCVGSEAECCLDTGRYWCEATTSCVVSEAECGPGFICTPEEGAYLEGEVFKVGGNAIYSKVNTYPIEMPAACRITGVKTCICDSISAPRHTLIQGVDFTISDGIVTIRKEKDPFEVDGYRMVPDGDDVIAVLWVCDASVDTNNVGDFLAYPLGFDVATDEESARALAALWDVIIYGATPYHINRLLGAVFGIDVIPRDTSVESVSAPDSAGLVTVVTPDTVYRVREDKLNRVIYPGAYVRRGTFLTEEVTVYQGLSQDYIFTLIDSGVLTSLTLPPGSIAGVSDTVTVNNIDSELQDGGWFRLNEFDSIASPFWSAVFARTTQEERVRLFGQLVNGGTPGSPTVNPLRALGYIAMANLILVLTTRPLSGNMCAQLVFDALGHLIPSTARMFTIHTATVDEVAPAPAEEVAITPDAGSKTDGILVQSESLEAGADSVSFSFVPVAATEV